MPDKSFVDLRCTDSIAKMSFFSNGDQKLAINSEKGQTYVLIAEITKSPCLVSMGNNALSSWLVDVLPE